MTTVLAVNAGSSSLRTALYRRDHAGSGLTLLARATVPRLAEGRLQLRIGAADRTASYQGEPLPAALRAYDDAGFPSPSLVGHRFVHGGPDLDGPRLLTPEVLEVLQELVAWAPLHQPAALAGVQTMATRLPGAVQVASFDTAFHRTMPEVAQRLPLPTELWKQGVRRYGFHGLSYEHVVHLLGAARLGRAVVAHLGNGSSLCAVSDGRSVDTTMGFTPDGGVPMGTRSGDLDPGVVMHLLSTGRSLDEVRDLVEHGAGLAGISGGESDMQALLARTDEPARLAVQTYIRRVAMAVGAFTTVLGGLDSLVFTGGIGEHAAYIREQVCARLTHLGVGDRVQALVVPADEEYVIARHAVDLAGRPAPSRAAAGPPDGT